MPERWVVICGTGIQTLPNQYTSPTETTNFISPAETTTFDLSGDITASSSPTDADEDEYIGYYTSIKNVIYY